MRLTVSSDSQILVWTKPNVCDRSLLNCSTWLSKTFVTVSSVLTCVCFHFASVMCEILQIFIIFQPLCTPIGASSKVVQLLEIIRLKNADSVSLLTWFISAATNACRSFFFIKQNKNVLLRIYLELKFSANLKMSKIHIFNGTFDFVLPWNVIC